MADSWLIVEANFPNLDPRSIIRDFVKPVIDKFESRTTTFHFFFEPHLLLRMKADKNFINQDIKPHIVQKLSKLNVVNPSVRIDDNYTEEPDYGDGWEVAQKIFELGSRSAILKAESDVGNVSLGPQFNEGKFMHLLLNQWGHSVNQEAQVHLNVVGERLAVLYSRHRIDLVERKLSQILTQLQNTFFPRIESLVIREMTKP